MLALISHLPRLLLAEDHIPSPFPSPPSYSRSSLSSSSTSLRPSIAVIVGILTIIFSLTFLLLLYAKHCNRHVTTSYPTGNGPSSSSEHRNSGVNRSVVDSLPVFRFGSLTGHKEGLDCAVCLTRFEPPDLLRLLPKCKHGFHVECVDIWLEAHSTCPLCRVRVDPEDVLLVLDPIPETRSCQQQQTDDGTAAVSLQFVRRISGRHSSAGEKLSSLVQIVARRMSEGGDGTPVNVGCFDKVRKDGMLSTESTTEVEREEFERRFSHRINVVSGGDGTLERWSDLKPSDLLYLRSEMIITKSGRISASEVGGGGGESGGRNVNSLRSVSEITWVSRFREGEERTMNKWLGFKAKRPATELTARLGK